MIHLGLLIAAFIVFLLAAFVPARINLVAIGLALFAFSFVVVGR